MNYDTREIIDIVDELVRMGLVKEIWPSDAKELKYVVTKAKGVE